MRASVRRTAVGLVTLATVWGGAQVLTASAHPSEGPCGYTRQHDHDTGEHEDSERLTTPLPPPLNEVPPEPLPEIPFRVGNDETGYVYQGSDRAYDQETSGNQPDGSVGGSAGVCIVTGENLEDRIVVENGGRQGGPAPFVHLDYFYVHAGPKCVAVETDGDIYRGDDAECLDKNQMERLGD